MTEFKAKAIHNVLGTFESVTAHETLFYNVDNGFSWIRGKNGEERPWQGYFVTAIGAEMSATEAGYAPEAIYYPTKE